MNRLTWTIAVLTGILIGAGAVWSRTSPGQATLRQTLAELRSRTSRPPRSKGDAANKVSPEEFQRLRDDGEAMARLRKEIELLKRHAEERARARIAREQALRAAPPPPISTPSISDEMLPASLWQNRGRVSPTDTVETVLWAAAGGDVSALADMLQLDAGARKKAAALLSQMPASIQAQCATPEQFVALLTANDIPLGKGMIITPTPEVKTEFGTYRIAQISDGSGKIKRAAIALNRDGELWRIVVPESAMDKYATQLKGTDVTK